MSAGGRLVVPGTNMVASILGRTKCVSLSSCELRSLCVEIKCYDSSFREERESGWSRSLPKTLSPTTVVRTTVLPEYFRYLRDPQSSFFSCGADTVLPHPRNVGRLLHSGRVRMVSIRGLNSGPGIFLQTRSLGKLKVGCIFEGYESAFMDS